MTEREALGFTKGYIIIFKGDTFPHKDYLKSIGAKYNHYWKWSVCDIPEELPEGIEPVLLPWSKVGDEKGNLYPKNKLREGVDSVLYTAQGEFYGEVGDRISIKVTIEKNITLDGMYGTSHMHIMRDNEGRVFVWNTTVKSWEVGTEHFITGKIKEHKIFRGIRQTVLIHCKEKAE